LSFSILYCKCSPSLRTKPLSPLVSILYWRCALGYGGVDCVCEQYVFQFSIGDAAFSETWHIMEKGISFNSLLEMPP